MVLVTVTITVTTTLKVTVTATVIVTVTVVSGVVAAVDDADPGAAFAVKVAAGRRRWRK